MEWDSLKSVGMLLLWGGFFFLMMRYGCGAHMAGGHGGHGRENDRALSKDPVCGMEVSPGNAAAASVHQSVTYYFCSAKCRDEFERTPEKFAAQSKPPQKHSHGGCHG